MQQGRFITPEGEQPGGNELNKHCRNNNKRDFYFMLSLMLRETIFIKPMKKWVVKKLNHPD